MTGLRPGTSPPPVRMAILSLDGTGMNLLRFFRNAQELDAYLHAGRKRWPGLSKSLRANAALRYRSWARGLRHTANFVGWLNRESGGKTAALQSSRIVSHRFGGVAGSRG